MSKNQFTFSKTKKYGEFSDEPPMTSATSCGDWLISTPDWDQSWAIWSQSLVTVKDWSKKWY